MEDGENTDICCQNGPDARRGRLYRRECTDVHERGRAEAETRQTGRYGDKETTSSLLQAWQEPPAVLQGCPQYRTRW